MSNLDKVAELSFFAEMESLADSEAHTHTFEGLDKIARKRVGNPIRHIRKGKSLTSKGLRQYFNRIGKT